MTKYHRNGPLRSCGRFALSVLSVSFLVTVIATAHAATGTRALDEAAIPVKDPRATFLDAITTAGHRLVAVGSHGVIVYSDDNGKTWAQASVPVDATLTSVAFSDSLNGWAIGNSGVILHTDDAGKSWDLQLTGVQANQLTLKAAQAAIASRSTAVGAPLAVKRAFRLAAMGPSVPFLSILVLSPQTAFVFGAYKMIVVTHDGGKSWTDLSLAIGDPVSHHLYDAVTINHDIYVVGEAGLVFRSVDGGISFPQASNAGSGTLFGVIGAGNGSILVYGVGGLMYRSENAGKDWTQIAVPVSNDLLAATTLSSGDILLVSGSGVLCESKDHGRSFVALPNTLPMETYAAVQAPDGKIIVVGDRGAMRLAGF